MGFWVGLVSVGVGLVDIWIVLVGFWVGMFEVFWLLFMGDLEMIVGRFFVINLFVKVVDFSKCCKWSVLLWNV